MSTIAAQSQDVTALYLPNTSSTNIVTEVYANAVKFFENELSEHPSDRAWISSRSSMTDVLQVVAQAKKGFETKSEKNLKARKWVNAFSSSITQYSAVLDVVVQADPLHAGLVWGAMKFVFSGILNEAELTYQLSKALTKIAEALPRVQVELNLYQTRWMQDVTARLYAHILLFLQKAVKWYNLSSPRRVLQSIFRPYKLAFYDIVADIKVCTETVDATASTLSRAEIRGITLALQESDEKLRHMQAQMNDFQFRTAAILDQILRVAMNNHSLKHTVKTDANDIQSRVSDVQILRILELLRPSVLPDDALRMCNSFARRRLSWHQPGRDTVLAIHRLKEWAQMPGSSMFIARAGSRAEARTKDMVVEITNLIKLTRYPVFWYFSPHIHGQLECSLSTVLMNLIFQALQHDPTILSQDPYLRNIQTFQADRSVEEWADLVTLILSRIRHCFVIVETEDCYHLPKRDIGTTQQITDTFNKIYEGMVTSGGVVKFLQVIYGGQPNKTTFPTQGTPITTCLNGPVPVVRRARQSLTAGTTLSRGRNQLRPKLVSRCT